MKTVRIYLRKSLMTDLQKLHELRTKLLLEDIAKTA